MNSLVQIEAFYRNLIPDMLQEEWEAVVKLLEFRIFQKNELLVKAGEICRHVYFINKGLVRIFYLVDGKEIVTGFVDTNNYVSEYAGFLTKSPSGKYLQSLDETEVQMLSYEGLQSLYNTYPRFQILGRKIAESLFILFDMQIDALTTLSPEDRYKRLIESRSPLLQNVPQYMLASYLGVTPEHLSRIRKKIFR